MPESLLQFPCQFPIKIIGRNDENLTKIIHNIIEPIYGSLTSSAITQHQSAQGNFQSITLTIEAQSQKQIDQIYQALTNHPSILMCL